MPVSKCRSQNSNSFPPYHHGSYTVETTTRNCHAYSGLYQANEDAMWRSAKAFSIIAVCIGGIAMFASFAALRKPVLWMIISIMLLITTLCQGLTFLFFSSSACAVNYPLRIGASETYYQSFVGDITIGDGCGLAAGAKLAISATVLWLFSALAAAAAGLKGASEEQSEVADVKQQELHRHPEEAVEEGK